MSVDRAHYAPTNPYQDAPQSIGNNATISAPHMHGYALEALSPWLKNGARVLDVGSGSGYLSAVMAKLVLPHGHVIGIDHVPELQCMALLNVKQDAPNLLEGGVLQFVVGDGRLGYAQGAPFDVIHVGAACDDFPLPLLD